MSAIEFVIAAATGGFLVLVGYALRAGVRPSKEPVERLVGAVRDRLPQGKGDVVRHSDEQLAELEREARGWKEAHDPNEGSPQWPG